MLKPMFSFICKSTLSRTSLSKTIDPNIYHSTVRWLSNEPNQHAFTVSYCINSFGFSQKAALTVSKLVSFKTGHKPDKAIEFLRDYGFTQTQISRLVRSFPRILTSNHEKTVLPKLEFLESKGIPRPKLAKSLSTFPAVLQCGLGLIRARYEFLVSFVMSDVAVAKCIRRNPNILVGRSMIENIAILQQHKVPNSNIAKLLGRCPASFIQNPDRFRKVVEEIEAMGFDASRMSFAVAVAVICLSTKSNWDAKVDLYKKWGWSHQEVLEAFKREPVCMWTSKEKILACADFLTNQMGLVPQSVLKCPKVFMLSLEKRVIPRCLVYQLLQSKGLEKKAIGLSLLLSLTEEDFLKRFVRPYENEAPELSKFYEEKVKLSNGSSSESV